MPTIPTYQGPQVATQALRTPQLGNIDVSSGAQALAKTGAALGEQVLDQAAQTDAWNAQAKINEDFVRWNAEARKNAQGSNARGYAEAVAAWWDKAKEEQFSKLSPFAQEKAAKALSTARLASLESANAYQSQQLEIGEKSALSGAVTQLANQAIAAGADKAQPVVDQLVAQLQAYGARKGVDVTPEIQKATTGVHLSLINTLLQGPTPERAQTYFDANKGQIDASQWDNVEASIKKGVEAGKAQAFGADVAARFGYTDTAAAQKYIDQQDWAPSLKAAVRQEVEHRHAVQQADDDKRNAIALGKISEAVERGASAAAIQRMSEFSQVRDKGAALKLVRERQEHIVALQAAQENRDWTRVQRLREEQAQKTQSATWAYSDPMVLTTMPREKVAALSLELGPINAQKLLDRYDSLRANETKLGEAKMDADQFGALATTAGLDPTSTNPNMRAKLQNARDRVEDAIALAEKNGNKRLTRDEKGAIMRREIGMEVTTSGFIFDSKQPYLTLTREDEAKVVVPGAAAQAIVSRARQQAGNPALQLTQDQIRAAYLAGLRSKAANGN